MRGYLQLLAVLVATALTALLDDLNASLVPVRKPGMYVTMACLRYEHGAGLAFSLAGHLPLLHYRAATGTVEERSIAPVSPMPANFAEQIPEADFYKHLAYLLTQRPPQ